MHPFLPQLLPLRFRKRFPLPIRQRFSRRRRPSAFANLLLVATVAMTAGCGSDDIDVTYGKQSSDSAGKSVNGVAVFAKMFDLRGHRVSNWRRLSPKLERYQTLVWFPDDFAPPDAMQREFLESWLANGTGRTLIYVGRDYDAEASYWAGVQADSPADAPEDQQHEVARRLAKARARHDNARLEMPENEFASWFTFQRDGQRQTIRTFQAPWASGVDAGEMGVEVEGRLQPPTAADARREAMEFPNTTVLLRDQDDIVAYRLQDDDWSDGKILVVINGSFLLNLPLVTQEHRKLAGRIIDQCDPDGAVCFLESGPGGLPIHDEEPTDKQPTGLEIFTIWPLGAIVLHLIAAGIVACVSIFPIFGRPAKMEDRTLSDFGKHIRAVGALLGATPANTRYARQRLAHYQHRVRGEAVRDPAQAALSGSPPKPEAIVNRALALGAFAFRYKLEFHAAQHPPDSAIDERPWADLARWMEAEAVLPHLSDEERNLMTRSPRRWTGEDLATHAGCAESLAVLLWSVGAMDSPTTNFDEPFNLDGLLPLVPIGRSCREFRRTGKLRSVSDFENARETSRFWYWRAQTERRWRDGVEPPPGETYESSWRKAAQAARRDGHIRGVVRGDADVGGRPYRDMNEAEYGALASVARHRHHALSWLCGHAENHNWDRTQVDS